MSQSTIAKRLINSSDEANYYNYVWVVSVSELLCSFYLWLLSLFWFVCFVFCYASKKDNPLNSLQWKHNGLFPLAQMRVCAVIGHRNKNQLCQRCPVDFSTPFLRHPLVSIKASSFPSVNSSPCWCSHLPQDVIRVNQLAGRVPWGSPSWPKSWVHLLLKDTNYTQKRMNININKDKEGREG